MYAALVHGFHPDNPFFAKFRWSMQLEQGTRGQPHPASRQSDLPLRLAEQLSRKRDDRGIVPLESNALPLRYAVLLQGPELAMERPEGPAEATQGELLEALSHAERRSGGGAEGVRHSGSTRRAAARLPRLQRGAEARAR